MSKNRWDDHYARRARAEQYLARSVYKLQEINQKYRLIRSGYRLLDLGCAPGSWSQYGLEIVGPQGQVTGIDLTGTDRLSSPNFHFIRADVLEVDIVALGSALGRVDAVLSDLAPKTTGVHEVDEAGSLLLARKAAAIAAGVLRTGGAFVCKVFEGGELQTFVREIANQYGEIRFLRPRATRKRSREVYVLGLQKKA